MLEYKGAWYGAKIVVADRWFPSSKTCLLTGLPANTPGRVTRAAPLDR